MKVLEMLLNKIPQIKQGLSVDRNGSVGKEGYPAIVEEIHRQFYTASERLLTEAKAVLDNTDENRIAKANRLHKIGFAHAVGVTEGLRQQKVVDEQRALQQLLIEYGVKYPTYKFITEAEIERICAKYKLVFGVISLYKGSVPEKNLAQIEAFPGVRKEDMIHEYRDINPDGSTSDWKPRFSDTVFPETEIRDSNQLGICAPLKDMRMDGMRLKGYLVVKKPVPVPDPVVLYSVRGGLYCIITAWGDEAADPMVMNPQLN